MGDAVVDRILPYLGLGEEIRADPQGARDRVSQILSTKSNTSGARRSQDTQWRGESVDVREEVAAASRAFMSGGMESIANLREGVKLLTLSLLRTIIGSLSLEIRVQRGM